MIDVIYFVNIFKNKKRLIYVEIKKINLDLIFKISWEIYLKY